MASEQYIKFKVSYTIAVVGFGFQTNIYLIFVHNLQIVELIDRWKSLWISYNIQTNTMQS